MSTTGIFNVQDYGVSPSFSPGTNTSALQTLVNNLLSGGSSWTNNQGGTISFPSTGTYQFNGPININAGPASLILTGTGEATFTEPLLEMVNNSDNLFVVNNSPSTVDDNIGGIVFQDLQIAYASGLTAGAAILVTNTPSGGGSQSIRIIRVMFQDCPQGVVFQNTLEALIDTCTFVFKNLSSSAPGVAITMDIANTTPPLAHKACNEILIRKSVIRTLVVPNTFVGVAIYACQNPTVETTTISGLHNGILVKPSSVEQNDTSLVTISNCNVGSPAAGLTLQPASTTGSKLREVRVIGSSFSQSPKDNTYTGAGIFISLPTLGTDNSQLDTVKLIGVTSEGWTGTGLQINGGQNIQIIGGTYAGNGSTYPGIEITGSPANVSLVGVDMPATYPGESAQQAALEVSGTPTAVLSKNCTMFGYSTSPVQVPGTPTNLQIADTAHYNDQNTALNGGVAPTTTALSASTCTTPYFGPSDVTFSSTSALNVTINTQTYSMTSGSIYLANPTDTIKFSALPTTFTWIGK